MLNCSHHYCSYCGKHKGFVLTDQLCNGTCSQNPDRDSVIKNLTLRRLRIDGFWLPIDQAPEEDGLETKVLLDGTVVLGRYECGHTWGWTDDRGNWIYPTHFKPGESK